MNKEKDTVLIEVMCGLLMDIAQQLKLGTILMKTG
ncbi:hypothetical protein ANCCAN_25771 [Ancylostoma caninum]|uniref:Uncharacterized protein n=1 Tax=Ancylostoma caninum TaxID=29170 RepID=A0A368F8K4_ANCCA|nr:hypothetical protein ANCCAN_25771 [Ancylostoma caninum]